MQSRYYNTTTRIVNETRLYGNVRVKIRENTLTDGSHTYDVLIEYGLHLITLSVENYDYAERLFNELWGVLDVSIQYDIL